MKVLLFLKDKIKVNIKGSVLHSESCEGYDFAFSINPKCLLRAVKELLGKGEVTEIVTCMESKSERKFRKIYADTINYLENQMNKDKSGLPEGIKPERKTFDISEKDKVLLEKDDVSKLEIAYINFKPKAKKFLFDLKARWKYLRDKTVFKKKIPVYENEKGYCFQAEGIRFFALEGVNDVEDLRVFLNKKLEENESYIVKEYDSKSKSFIANRVPLRTDDKREVIRKSVQAIALVAFVVAGIYLLYNTVYKSAENTAIQSEIQSIYYDGDTSKKTSEEEKIKNFKKLKDINSEIVAWIYVPHTNIDYPVLFHKDDTLTSQYYLYNNYEKNYSDYGSIFVDFRSQQGVKSQNVIMHGHHMMDGSMFSNLLKYGKTSIDMDFYKKAPTFTLSTPEGDNVYKIISVMKTTGSTYSDDFFNYLQGDFANGAEFLNFVYNVRARSMVNCPVDVNENDNLATLSTCSYEVNENYRTVIIGRKVREGETKTVTVANATKNKNPYFPKDYYWRFGGTQPKLTSFKVEYKKGNIDWYDGNGKLKGNEKLTGGKFVRDRTTTTTTKVTSSSSTSATSSTTKQEVYTVKFLDSRGYKLSLQKVRKGEDARSPKHPHMASTKYYKYKFLRWDKSYTNVQKDLVIKPVYKSIKITKPTKPKPTKPKPTKPKPTKPKPTKPKPTKPKPTVKPTVKPTTKPTTQPVTTTEVTVTVPQTQEDQNEV